jgi:hypothetical protein
MLVFFAAIAGVSIQKMALHIVVLSVVGCTIFAAGSILIQNRWNDLSLASGASGIRLDSRQT